MRRQVLSAIGQVRLMDIYRQLFLNHGLFCAQVLQGKAIFHQLQCAACHQPKMQTAAAGPTPALNNQTISYNFV